ncbi:AAA domain-containing protein, partial [Actinomadura adrarensis]
AAGDAWLRVGKVARPVPPALPTGLADVLYGVVRDDPYAEPVLPDDLSERLDDPARIAEDFYHWRDVAWSPWAEGARAAVDARELYETLFRLRQRMRADEATHELVWGHGVLGWWFGGHRICHPLLITQVRVAFDEETGELSLVPDGLTALELDCLQGLGVPNMTELGRIQEALRTEPVEVWGEVGPLYRRVLAPLGLDGRVVEGAGLPEVEDAPVIGTTWRVFVRKRRVKFLKFFEQLKNAMDDRETLPAPMVALASGEDVPQEDEWERIGEQLLMPLPSNDEQEQIARKLARHSGVTVQGPPGTGKSHTIANLVSHLVAHGKRVLVTAHKDQALAVLQEKIPAELRDLSLAVMGSSSAELVRLQRSVQAITSAADSVDERRETLAIEALRDRL